MAYDFDKTILGSITGVLDRNEQKRQFNINDQWRNYALQQELNDREKQRAFTHGEGELDRGLSRETRDLGFAHSLDVLGREQDYGREILGRQQDYGREMASSDFGVDPETGEYKYMNFRGGGKGFVPSGKLGEYYNTGALLPKNMIFDYPREDFIERAFRRGSKTNMLAMIAGNALAPGVGPLPFLFGGGDAAEFFGSKTAERRRALTAIKRNIDALKAKDPKWPYKYAMAKRLGLMPDFADPSAVHYSF